MPNLKFSQFLEQTDPANVQFVVGYNGTDNVRIAPGDLGGGYPFLIDTQSLYSGFVPSGLSGNPQGNTVLGISAGNSLTSSIDNTLIGDSAGKSITNNSIQNVIVGSHAGEFKSAGSQSTLVGYQAGQNSSGANTILIGMQAGRFNTADQTIAIGYNAARTNASQTHVSIGSFAGYSNTTGSGNVNIGPNAGANLTTGSNNTNIGDNAGSDVTGNNNVLLGYRAGNDAGAWNNTIIIGHDGATSPVGASNFIVLGNSSHTTLQIPGIQSGASNGDVLTYNATFGKLELQTPSSGGATSLNGLSDVSIDLTNDSAYFINIPAGLSGATGNLVIGESAGNALTSGDKNIAIGFRAMNEKTVGSNNIAIGYDANRYPAANSNAVAIGTEAVFNATGNDVIGIGFQAGYAGNQDGSVSIGTSAHGTGFNANDAVAIGNAASYSGVATGSVVVGKRAGFIGNDKTNSVLIGFDAGRAVNSATNGAVSIGYRAGYSQTSGANNTNVGYKAGYSTTTGASNTTLGYNTLGYHNGNNNVAVGTNAMQGASSFSGTGNDNVAIGFNAGSGSQPTAFSNSILIGKDAATSPLGASNFIVLGNSSHTTLQIPGIQSGASDGDVLTYNATFGKLELQAAGGGGASDLNGLSDCDVSTSNVFLANVPSGLTNPSENVVIGIDAGNSFVNPLGSVIIGYQSFENYGKDYTTAVGTRTGRNVNGTHNTFLGFEAGQAFGVSSTDARYNVMIGYRAGNRISGAAWTGNYANSCTYLGFNTGSGAGSLTGWNQIVIGAYARPSTGGVDSEITLGDSNITALRCAVTSITSLSDERDKSEIKDLEYGLDFIDALQPREFVWDNRPETRPEFDEDGNETEVEFYSTNKGKKDFGFIAQEVRELDNDTLRLVYAENEDRLEMSYGKLVPILVKAIQELKEEVEILKSQNN